MTVKLAPGTTRVEDRGHLTVSTTRYDDGISINVTCGPHRSSVLSRTFTNDRLRAGRIWYREITEAADQGVKVTAIEDRMATLLAAGIALTEGAPA